MPGRLGVDVSPALQGLAEGDLHVSVEDKQVFPGVLDQLPEEVVDEGLDGGGGAVLVRGGEGQGVVLLVGKEDLEAASAFGLEFVPRKGGEGEDEGQGRGTDEKSTVMGILEPSSTLSPMMDNAKSEHGKNRNLSLNLLLRLRGVR